MVARLHSYETHPFTVITQDNAYMYAKSLEEAEKMAVKRMEWSGLIWAIIEKHRADGKVIKTWKVREGSLIERLRRAYFPCRSLRSSAVGWVAVFIIFNCFLNH